MHDVRIGSLQRCVCYSLKQSQSTHVPNPRVRLKTHIFSMEFCDEAFDIKAWINRACTQTPADEHVEKHLAEVEMRLQLTAEEIESSLHDLSVQAMRRIPFAVQEIYRLQGDIQGMQDQMGGLAASVKRDATAAMESVVDLQQLDRVKRNMESACSTLKEATELSGLFIKVTACHQAAWPRTMHALPHMRL